MSEFVESEMKGEGPWFQSRWSTVHIVQCHLNIVNMVPVMKQQHVNETQTMNLNENIEERNDSEQKLSSQKFKDRNGNPSQLSLVSKLFQILKFKMLQKYLERNFLL
jgi:hypothetical protein